LNREVAWDINPSAFEGETGLNSVTKQKGRTRIMTWSGGINLFGFGILVTGTLLLIWSLARGDVSAVGLGILIAWLVLQLLAAVFTN
jgi:hypothetical protein